MSNANPYAAPKATVADESVVVDADYIPFGQAVPSGRGAAWISAAWRLFRRQPLKWVLIWVLFIVIFLAASILPLLGMVLPALFWPVFVAGFALGCRAIEEGQALEVGHLFAGFRERFAALVGVGALSFAASFIIGLGVSLALGVGAFTLMQGDPEAVAAMAGTTVALVVLVTMALMLPVIMAAWFAPLLVVFHQEPVVEAMKSSFAACLKNIVPFLVYGVLFFVIALLASLPIFLGWLVAGPLLSISVYTSYQDIYLKPRA